MSVMLLVKFWRELSLGLLLIALTTMTALYNQRVSTIKQLKTEHKLQLMTQRALHAENVQKMEQQAHAKIINAQNEAKKREIANARAVADANTANKRLSQTIDTLAANAKTDAKFRVEYATTTGELLKECSGQLTDLAKKADGHVNDIRTLQQAR